MSVLELAFLGQAQFRWRDEYIMLPSAKAQALLVYLAVRRSPQGREHIQTLLWPDSLPQAAQKNLRNILWSIRRELGEEVVRSQSDRLSLGATVWVDIHVMEDAVQALPANDIDELEAAAALYRGALMEGLYLAEAPEFELWLTTARERLARIYLQLSEALVTYYQDRGNWPAVVSAAQRSLMFDSLHEPSYRAMIVAFAQLGDRAQAARQYETLKRLLAQELGVEPLPETAAIYQEVLDNKIITQTNKAWPPSTRPPGMRKESHSQTPFVGRSLELSGLDEEWASVLSGQARIVALEGNLGMGKSRLWQQWSLALPGETVVYQTYCLDTTQSDPFAPVIALLRQSPAANHIYQSPTLLDPTWLAELSRLLPELPQHWPSLPLPLSLQSSDERLRLFETLTQVILLPPHHPRILFVDDVHWVDSTTLDWLIYLVDRLRSTPFMLVLALRPEDAPVKVSNALAAWQRQQLLKVIQLTRLNLSDTTTLLTALGEKEERATELHARSSGNPYFLMELSRMPPGETPPVLADLVRTRLSTLPSSIRPVLNAAAILTGHFDFDTLQHMAGQSALETLDALDALLDVGILSEHGELYSFDNPLAAVIVRDGLSIARYRFLHLRAAQAMQTVYARQLAPVAAQMAWHFAEGGDPVQAASFAEMAAQHALAVAAPQEAVALYRQALLWEPTMMRQVGLGQALLAQGDAKAAHEVMLEAVRALDNSDDRITLTHARLSLASSYMISGQREKVVYWAQLVLKEGAEELPPDRVAQAHIYLAIGILGSSHDLDEADFHLLEARRIALEYNLPSLEIQSQFERGTLMAQRGDLEGAIETYAGITTRALEAGEPLQGILAYNNLAYHEMLLGRLDQAQQHVEAGIRLADAYSLDPFYAYLYSTRGEIALAFEQLEEAETWFARAFAAAERWGNLERRAGLRANQGLIARARGSLDDAFSYLEEARNMIAGERDPFLQTKIDLWLAEVHLMRGDQNAALEALDRAEDRLSVSEYEGLRAWAARLRTTIEG